ncbi:MAG: hypothetical protein CFE44_10930 [Burkholderiales bacterium PBB4]|nr:MAG: hypothetical protein CFE44_10930 [Burkholderiales bacterium PBB4]
MGAEGQTRAWTHDSGEAQQLGASLQVEGESLSLFAPLHLKELMHSLLLIQELLPHYPRPGWAIWLGFTLEGFQQRYQFGQVGDGGMGLPRV